MGNTVFPETTRLRWTRGRPTKFTPPNLETLIESVLIAIPELEGKYVFGDFSLGFQTPGGRLFYGDLGTSLIQEFMIGLDDRALGLFVKRFGQDADGELYVLADLSLGANSNLGEVLKIVAAPVSIPAAVWLFGSALGALVIRRRSGFATT